MDRTDIRNGMLVMYQHSGRVWKVDDKRPRDVAGDLKKGGRYLRITEWDYHKRETTGRAHHVKPAELRSFTSERHEELAKSDEAAIAAADKIEAEFNEVNAFFESVGLTDQVTLHTHRLALTDRSVPSYWSLLGYLPSSRKHRSGHTDLMRVLLCEFGVLEPVPTGDSE